jgi:cytoplasmic iron level regulating protein YaaA (DUF328/UPF0246 family)
VLILLPPSEGKADPGPGDPLDLGTLSLPELNRARERVLRALMALCGAADGAGPDDTEGMGADGTGPDAEAARMILGLSPGQLGEVARNARLCRAPAAPAGRIYTGVLYGALGLGTLGPEAYRRAERSILVFSALWGAVRLGDRIPVYRCAVGVKLPGLGALGAYWRAVLPAAMTRVAADGLVLDLRSGAYAAMWAPRGEAAERTVTVRVLHERVVGGVVTRSVVSHFNKATKGRLVRALVTAGVAPRSPGELVTALRDLGYQVVEHRPGRLDVVVTEL